MISNNYIPEKINDATVYLDGELMVGVTASVTLPQIKMKTSTTSGIGVSGDIDSPTIGQFEPFEQKINFNTLYSSAMAMLNPIRSINITFRAVQQVYDKSGGYVFKSLKVMELARVKSIEPGNIEKSNGMDAAVTAEVTRITIDVDGEQLLEIDKLNGVYRVNGEDMLEEIKAML